MTMTSTSDTRRPTGAPILEVTDLQVSFPSEAGRVDAVRGVNFSLERGRTLAIVGESGSGKSVTSLAIMGLLAETASVSGSVLLEGEELLGRSDKQMSSIRGKRIAMIFQDPLSSLTPVYSVGDQIVEALLLHNPSMGKKEAWERAVELLDTVGIPNPAARAKAFPHEFSGGMRQRVVIAIAMANSPDIIIADEPTTALDVTVQAQILDVLRTAQRETGAAVIMITHDMGVVAATADDVLVMYAGKPVEQAPVLELFRNPRMPYTIGLLGAIPSLDTDEREPLIPIKGNPPLLIDLPAGCPFAPRCPVVKDECKDSEPDLLGSREHSVACLRRDEIQDRTINGEPVYEVPERVQTDLAEIPREERDTVLEVTNLSKTYPLMKGSILKRRVGWVYAVDRISFDIARGETLAIVGESGCGKSTTLLQIMDMITENPDSDIRIEDVSVINLKGKQKRETRRQLQMVFQDPMGALDPRMTVGDIIGEPLRAQGWNQDRVEERVAELMDLVGLDPSHVERFPGAFSGGQRQRIGIARALSTNPKLLVLDEPVSALDVSIQAGVINLLADLQAKLGISYLFVAHDLSVVRHIADRVAVMYVGRFVEYGRAREVFAQPQHPYTQALLSAIPIPDPEDERNHSRIVLEGDLPSPTDDSAGCRFANRCPLRQTLDEADAERCTTQTPGLHRPDEAIDHSNACHFR